MINPESNLASAHVSPRAVSLAAGTAVVAIAAAYAAPEIFPLRGADGQALPLALQHSFTTAWAAMAVAIPAFVTFWFRRRSPVAAAWWRAFWTAGCVVFLIHFAQGVFVFFQNDWSRILQSEKVPRLGTVVTAWWVVDVVLAWAGGTEGIVIRSQRVAVHGLLLLIFLLASLKNRTYPISFVVGGAMAVSVLGAILLRFRGTSARGN